LLVAGLIISTDARRLANDKMHAIYPLMRAHSRPPPPGGKKWPDIIMIISALWRLFMIATAEIMMLKSGKIVFRCYFSPFCRDL
jgi:hypothetical protein